MSCFTLSWLMQLCIWVVIISATIAIIRLLLPWLLGLIGIPIVGQIINIVLWAVVAIMVIYVIFALLSCLLGGGAGLLRFPMR